MDRHSLNLHYHLTSYQLRSWLLSVKSSNRLLASWSILSCSEERTATSSIRGMLRSNAIGTPSAKYGWGLPGQMMSVLSRERVKEKMLFNKLGGYVLVDSEVR